MTTSGSPMIRSVLMLVVVHIAFMKSAYATTYMWNNCSLPVYAYPYGLEKHRIVIENITDKWLADYIGEKRIERSEVESKLVGMPNLEVDLSVLAEEDIKKLAEQAFMHLKIKKQLNTMPNYPDSPPKDLFSKVRLLYVVDLFRAAGKEVQEKEGIEANFSPHYFSACEYDHSLINRVAKKTLENIRDGKF
ncbi:hypothetical protein FKG94_13795 [Exilibacterium tricleocarpae]|uniref:Uncharacterized protein n=1 Tax=Exilibacterium tricleocarpae TaxID=2591008 RepID=A0A545TLN5_9GAMM|nr:hypothetical protein [Exilibacterium tricleocarpae]TQV78147.1 hypothetical protein FKG94_13795 [Exilibacterium tricleocarpae]